MMKIMFLFLEAALLDKHSKARKQVSINKFLQELH